MGKFLVFEGIDGSGKSTQIEMLKNHLVDSGFKVLLTREPGGTPMAEDLRIIIKRKTAEQVHNMTELLIFNAARYQHYHNVIKPALDQGVIVLCDRFVASTIAFQSVGRGMSLDLILKVDEIVMGGVRPDMTLVLDIDVYAGIRRIQERDEVLEDRFDDEDIDFMCRVRSSYLEQVEQNPDTYRIISADNDIESVHRSICKTVSTLQLG